MPRKEYPETPDGRYFVSKGRLWRKTDPTLDDAARRAAVKRLMQGRLGVRNATTEAEERASRAMVDAAKRDLGERGPVWWADGAPDQTMTAPENSSYADWWATLDDATRARGT